MKEALNDAWFTTDPLHGVTKLLPKMRNIEAAEIAELDACELGPEVLPRVELRGVGGEALQVDALGGPICQEVFDPITPVDWGAIPDQDYATWHLTQQMLQKRDHVFGVDRVVLTVKIEFALRRYRADGREVIPGPPLLQDGGMPNGRIGADDTGQGIEPGFVYKEEAAALGLRPLLRAGQVAWRQRVMAASSR
jgi:hypothetical protein